MKNVHFTLLVLFFLTIQSALLLAQSVETDNVLVNYTQKPLTPLPDDVKTYSTMIRSGYILFNDKARLERDYLRQLIGYQHVAQNGDLMILVTFRGLDIVRTEVKNDESGDKGKFNFRYNITYTFPMKYEIYNQKTNTLIEEKEVSTMYQELKVNFGKNNEFATEELLIAGFKEQKNDFFVNLENTKAVEFLEVVRNALTDNYSFLKKSYNVRIGCGKDRKLDYTEQENAKNYATRAYKLLDQGKDPLSDFQKAIAIWEEELKELNLNDKKARINRKVGRWLHYNLVMAHIWMDDYESAEKYMTEIELVEPQGLLGASFDEKELKNFLNDRKLRYQANL
jgi:hypothetical protein